MTLQQKQCMFAGMVAKLIVKAGELGYQITLGEAYRPPEQAELMAKQGKGIKNSLHTLRLAIDVNLFKNGTFLTASKDYAELGDWWEEQGGSWGGHFNDGNHFSLSHNGVK